MEPVAEDRLISVTYALPGVRPRRATPPRPAFRGGTWRLLPPERPWHHAESTRMRLTGPDDPPILRRMNDLLWRRLKAEA